jgi:hypothetical protein
MWVGWDEGRNSDTLTLKVKKGTNKMPLIWCLFTIFVSTCFGHHYAHHQENQTVFCTGCYGHCCEKVGRECQRPPQPVQNTICGRIQSGSPDEGHNGARNMLRQKLWINIRLVASCWSLSSPYFHDARSHEPKTLTLACKTQHHAKILKTQN